MNNLYLYASSLYIYYCTCIGYARALTHVIIVAYSTDSRRLFDSQNLIYNLEKIESSLQMLLADHNILYVCCHPVTAQ